MKKSNIFDSIRKTNGLGAIVTADWYVKQYVDCVQSGGSCPVEIMGGKQYLTKDMQIARSRLAYCDPESDIIAKSLNRIDPSPQNGSAIMTMESILTTKSKDRDGDIVEPSGLTIDRRLPLLWQHVPSQPVGAMIKVLRQDDDAIVVKSQIADTALGRDVAALIEVGALRISQGFKPTEAIPLSKKSLGNGKFKTNWHVKKGMTIEHSVVSIPSNAEAVILTYSRKSLESPIVTSWAKSYYDDRPAIGVGFDFENGEQEMTVKTLGGDTKSGGIEAEGMKKEKGSESNEAEDEASGGADKESPKKKKKKGDHDHREGFEEDSDNWEDGGDQPGDMSKKSAGGDGSMDGTDGGDGKKKVEKESDDDDEDEESESESDDDESEDEGDGEESEDDSDESDDDEEDEDESQENDLESKANWGKKDEKGFSDYLTKAMSIDNPYLPGSYEYRSFCLRESIADKMGRESYSINITATFDDRVVYCITEYTGRKYATKCYVCDYSFDETGTCTLGEFKEADIERRLVEKSLEFQAVDRSENIHPESIFKHISNHFVRNGISDESVHLVKALSVACEIKDGQDQDRELEDILNSKEKSA